MSTTLRFTLVLAIVLLSSLLMVQVRAAPPLTDSHTEAQCQQLAANIACACLFNGYGETGVYVGVDAQQVQAWRVLYSLNCAAPPLAPTVEPSVYIQPTVLPTSTAPPMPMSYCPTGNTLLRLNADSELLWEPNALARTGAWLHAGQTVWAVEDRSGYMLVVWACVQLWLPSAILQPLS